MGRRRPSLVAFAAVALVALVACSSGGAPLGQPSSAFPGTSAPTIGKATGPGIPVATITASSAPALDPATGDLTSGSLSFQVSGDLQAQRTLERLVATISSPPPGGIAVVWTAGGTAADTVGLGGTSFVGARPTTPSLTLTIAVQTPEGIETFISFDGECSITLTAAEADALEGRFACRGLRSSTGAVVDATGSFSAAG